MLLFPVTVLAQQIDITEAVIDSNGEPLIGVSIKITGSKYGTVTGMDGNLGYRDLLSDMTPMSFYRINGIKF
jgi:hypothetical protein